MKEIVSNKFDDWEVSIIKFTEGKKIKFKITRRFPKLSVAETKIFTNLEEAEEQFKEWTN